MDGQEFWYGLVRKNKDANRLFNMSATSVAEMAATTSKDMPIFTDAQVEGRESELSEMHLGKYNYVKINDIIDQQGNAIQVGPVGTWAAPRVDPNNAAVMQISSDYIREETGGVPAEAMDVEMSGKLFNAMNQRIDLNSFTLMDNIAKTQKRGGEVYREIAGEIYSTARVMNRIEEDGSEKQTQLFEVVIDEETGEPRAINDITTGKFEVIVDTGPAFSSRRRETLETMKDVLAITPESSPYFTFLYNAIIQNVDGVGLDDLKEFGDRQMLLSGHRQPENDEEAAIVQQAQEQQRDEQGELMGSLGREADANAQESLSNVAKNASQARLNDARSAETLNKIDLSRLEALTKVIDQRRETLSQIPRLTSVN